MLTVKKRQEYLSKLGFYDGKIDGIEDGETRKAYLSLQKKYFPKSEQDGLYGDKTDILLLNAIRVKNRTKNFKLEEFKCECGGKYCTGYPDYLRITLLENLQKVRNKYGAITITSGLRCQKYNNSLNGSITTSRHTQGKAADIYIKGATDTAAQRAKVKKYWYTLPSVNYTYSDTPNMGNAVHVDVK